jgi:hypothetical protein
MNMYTAGGSVERKWREMRVVRGGYGEKNHEKKNLNVQIFIPESKI